VDDALALVDAALVDARNRAADTPFRDRVLLSLTLADLYLLTDQRDRARTLLDAEAAFAEDVLRLARRSSSSEQVHTVSVGCCQLRDRATQVGLLGQEAPDIDVTEWVQNGPTTLAEQRGSVVLLEFWAPWCGPCSAMFPVFRDLHDRYARDGLNILALTDYRSRDDAGRARELDSVRQFIVDHEVEFAVGVAPDGRLRQTYGANGLPSFALVDRAGIVRLASSKPDKAALEQGIVGLLNTSSDGCS
jgi:thiol-disulfide isomerase/thioredoxin